MKGMEAVVQNKERLLSLSLSLSKLVLEFILSNLCQGLFHYMLLSLVKQIEACFQVDQQSTCVMATVSKTLLFTEASHTLMFW